MTPGCRLQTEQKPVATEVMAPDFSLAAHDGRTVTLGALVADGPAVLVFYRGHW
jgi:peroxiredoxin